MKGLHDVTLMAIDVEQLRDFYVAIGLELVMEEGTDLVVFAAGTNELAIHASDREPEAAVGLSFLVAETESYQKRLHDQGIEFEGPMPLRPGLVGLSLKDPNGNTIEFLSPA